MGKKYIIELLDDCQSEFKGILTFGVTQEKQISIELIPEEDLTPYTEPDLGALAKENFERGYRQRKAEDEKEIQEIYQRGLSDAWEAARTLWNTPNRKEIFGHTTFNTVLTTLTAKETIEKIRQYEQKQEMDGLRQNIQTIVDQCGYTLDEIAEVLQKMKENQ